MDPTAHLVPGAGAWKDGGKASRSGKEGAPAFAARPSLKVEVGWGQRWVALRYGSRTEQLFWGHHEVKTFHCLASLLVEQTGVGMSVLLWVTIAGVGFSP